MMLLKPGIHAGVPMDDYIRDPAEVPSLNATAANLILQRSPLHAWHANGRLNPNWKPESAERADIGSVAHHVLLKGDTRDIEIVDADDWRTKLAKERRDEAYSRGAIPILIGKMEVVHEMVEAARAQLANSELAGLLDAGTAELTLIADAGPCWVRSRPDWWTADKRIMFDLKTTTASAEPNSFVRQIITLGYDLQAQIATDAAYKLAGERPEFVFGVLEQEPPYGLSLVALTPQLQELAMRKLDYAQQLWAQCLKSDKWPGYPSRICWAEAPDWHARSVEDLLHLGEPG